MLASGAGDLELRIRKLRAGSFFPSLLERRRRVGQSMFTVIMGAYLHGTSTRKIDDLVNVLGADSGSASPRCPAFAPTSIPEVGAFRDRPLYGQVFRYVFLDATYCKARVDHRVVYTTPRDAVHPDWKPLVLQQASADAAGIWHAGWWWQRRFDVTSDSGIG